MANNVESRVQVAKTSLGVLEILEVWQKAPGTWAHRCTASLPPKVCVWCPPSLSRLHLVPKVAGTLFSPDMCHHYSLCR